MESSEAHKLGEMLTDDDTLMTMLDEYFPPTNHHFQRAYFFRRPFLTCNYLYR